MSNILVLMRHGKAERPTEGKLDMERKLTAAGRRALAAALPESLRLVPQGDVSLEVWASPAARAEQTARLVLQACKQLEADVAPDLVLDDSLWIQDADAFLEKARACTADVMVAVGHDPFIEDLTARLTSSRVVFATGALAAIDLDGKTGERSDEGRLLWFVQGPVSQRWKTLVQMERILAEAADTVQSRRDAFIAEPEDVETMHKLRVSIRTLRSLLAFTAPWQNAKQNKDVQRRCKGIVAETSRLRELDVLAEQAAEMEGASDALVEYCLGLASTERARVLDFMSSKKVERELKRIVTELHDVKWRKGVEAEGLDAAEVRSRFDGLTDELRAALEVLDIADAEQTHDVRKAAKRVRYDAEKFESLIGSDAPAIAKGMTAHQDNLGAICDARVNIDIVESLEVDGLPEPLAWDLALLRAQNETYLYSALRNR